MKRMKRVCALMMLFCLCMGLSACGSSAGQTETSGTEPAKVETAEASGSVEDDPIAEGTASETETL